MMHRMMPPSGPFGNPITLNGTVYSCASGSTIDVVDHVAALLKANGWQMGSDTGADATANRPAKPNVGQTFLDTTLGYVVKWDGKVWRNPSSGVAV